MSQQDNSTKIALLEQEVDQITEVFGKLSDTIDKITDVSNCINKMLAVHEQRINQLSEDNEDIFHLVEKRRIEMDENIKDLHSRITTGNREMAKELSDAFSDVHDTLNRLEIKMDKREDVLMRTKNDLEQRIAQLEKWRWLSIGAAATLGAIVGNIDLITAFLG